MSNCFLIILSFSELLLVFYEPAECTFVHNITVFILLIFFICIVQI
nr:MAG TPA: hypothetical protein [Caudoviricetes sp.]